MFYKLTANEEIQLLNLPETGMGYQIIEASEDDNYQTKRFVVLNSELIIESFNAEDVLNKILIEGIAKFKAQAKVLNLKNIAVLNKFEAFGEVNEDNPDKIIGAKDSPETRTDGKELFVRLSPFYNDRRIDRVKKCLHPQSFATTFIDYDTCRKQKIDPVERLALPSEEQINWVFHIRPTKLDVIQRGIVQPANGHNGGGAEAYFKNGTSVGTFIGETKY
ncbi:hypothetical protein BH10BAC1_BH10BAC1_03140 [soil metagenome]